MLILTCYGMLMAETKEKARIIMNHNINMVAQ